MVLVLVSLAASYLRLLMRRLSPPAARKLFQIDESRKIQADRERVGVSISALHGAAMALLAVGVTGLLIREQPGPLWESLAASFAALACVIALFDQLIPFLLVARHDDPEVILARWMPVLRLAVFAALPLTFPILISSTLRQILDPSEQKTEESTPQEELQEILEARQEEGLLEKGEGELLQSVVEFGDKIVRGVMTPRPEIAAIEIHSSVADLRRLFREKRQSRYPVYADQLERIEGMVTVQDLMELSPEEQSKATLRSLMRPVPFVPETKPIRELLKELQQSTTQLAIVIDEYGIVSGLVTIEDLLEEIVGEIRDTVESHALDIVKESPGSYLVAGRTELAAIHDRFQAGLESPDYSTVAGLVLAQLGRVPAPGEKVEAGGLTFQVLEANQRTVLKVRLTVPAVALSGPAAAPAPSSSASEAARSATAPRHVEPSH